MTGFFRLPFMLTFLLVMASFNWLAGTFSGILPPHALTAWGISHYSILNGEVFRLMTGTFLSHDFGMFVRQFGFAAVVIGAYEWVEGTWRALAVFFTIDILGSLLVLFGVLPLLVGLNYTVGEAELLTHDVGMSAGGFGLLGAILANRPHRWRLLCLVTLGILGKMWLEFEPIADTAHLLCLFLGFGLQTFLKTWPVARGPALCLQKDRDELMAFFDFPAQHWQSIRTSNPIESAFATIRHRTKRSKGCLTRDGMLHMIFKLGQCAEQNWSKLRGFDSLAKVITGVKFKDGIETTQNDQIAA